MKQVRSYMRGTSLRLMVGTQRVRIHQQKLPFIAAELVRYRLDGTRQGIGRYFTVETIKDGTGDTRLCFGGTKTIRVTETELIAVHDHISVAATLFENQVYGEK